MSALLLLVAALSVQAKPLRVVATVPDLAELTRRVGGEHVDVTSLARGSEDIHQVTMRPSFVSKLNKADAVVMLGLSVEHSFLPGLLEAARNNRIKPDFRGCTGPGCIDCSKGLEILDMPETVSRAEGELHPEGNPHYNIGPANGPLIVKNIAEGLSSIDPAHAETYRKNAEGYVKELGERIAVWRKWVEPLKGLKAISYHRDVAYLERFTGLEFVDTVEYKPGVAPTPTHLERLVKKMKELKVALIVREQHYDLKAPKWLAEQTGAKIATIGTMGGSLPGTESWEKLMEANLRAILKAAGKEPS